MDYSVFDGDAISHYEMEICQVQGTTPDERVNSLHYDAVALTVDHLAGLASLVQSGQKTRLQKKAVRTLVAEALDEGKIDRARCNADLLSKFE